MRCCVEDDLSRHPQAVEERKRAFLNIILNGGRRMTEAKAARLMGITPKVVNGWKKRDPEFAEDLKDCKRQTWANDVDALMDAVLKNALENENFSAQKWLLQKLDPTEWADEKTEEALPATTYRVIEAVPAPKRIHELEEGPGPVDSSSSPSPTPPDGA